MRCGLLRLDLGHAQDGVFDLVVFAHGQVGRHLADLGDAEMAAGAVGGLGVEGKPSPSRFLSLIVAGQDIS